MKVVVKVDVNNVEYELVPEDGVVEWLNLCPSVGECGKMVVWGVVIGQSYVRDSQGAIVGIPCLLV